MSINLPRKIQHIKPYQEDNYSEGFTIIEVAAVLAVLSSLSAIAVPNIIDTVELSKVDETKAIMNMGAAECLQQYRLDESNFSTFTPASISSDKLATLGYKTKSGSNTCADLMLEPTNSQDKLRYQFGFSIVDGKITKKAFPAEKSRSLGSCKGWAGNNCGASAEQLARWEEEKKLAEKKRVCEATFVEWMNAKNTGSFERWDDSTNTCTKTTWVFEGRITGSKEANDRALAQKYGEKCSDWVTEQRGLNTTNSSDSSGNVVPMSNEFCGNTQYFFCLGENKGSSEAWDSCIEKNKSAKCISDRAKARTSNHSGKYPTSPIPGPDPCGVTVWMCNGTMVFTEEDYKATTCGQKPKDCGFRPHWYCINSEEHMRRPECIEWCTCSGYL